MNNVTDIYVQDCKHIRYMGITKKNNLGSANSLAAMFYNLVL